MPATPLVPQPATSLTSQLEAYRQLTANHATMMALIDSTTGRIMEANAATCAFYGYDHATLCGMSVTEISQIPPGEFTDRLQQVLRRENTVFTAPHRLANGAVRTIETQSSPVIIDGRSYIFITLHDITAHANTEADLRQLAQRLAMINDIGQAISSTLDLDQILIILLERTRQAVGAEVGAGVDRLL